MVAAIGADPEQEAEIRRIIRTNNEGSLGDPDKARANRGKAMREVFAILRPEQREVVELKCYGGLTLAEVAPQAFFAIGTQDGRTHLHHGLLGGNFRRRLAVSVEAEAKIGHIRNHDPRHGDEHHEHDQQLDQRQP